MLADNYPLETISFSALPEECPLHILDHGMMTELIQDKVVIARRDYRKQKKDRIVKKLTIRFLKECLYGLSDLGVIDLHRKKHVVSSKKKIVDYVDHHFIPLIYLEEALEKLERGSPVFKVGDRVRCLKLKAYAYTGEMNNIGRHRMATGEQCGIISYVAINNNFQVDFVKMRGLDDNGDNILYPDFSQMSYSYGSVTRGKYVNGWDLEKVGEETVVSKSLRKRFEQCEEDRKMKINDLWNNHLEKEIILYQQERITKEQAIAIYLHIYRFATAELAISTMGISEDEMVSKGRSMQVSVYCKNRIKSCKNIWFCGVRMNILDKKLWKTIDEPTNALNIGSRKFGCGYTMKDVEMIKHILDRDNLL